MTKAPISLQDLRRRMYRKAKAEKAWRFWGLYVHVCKMETLREAYSTARQNNGAPGIDGVTFEAIEESGVEGFLERIRDELVSGTYRPLRNRRKEIPKGNGKVRVLGIPWIHIRAKDGWLPKNKKDRKLPMHPRVRDVLEHQSRKHRWVFVAGLSTEFPKGGHQIHLDHLRERLLGILRKIGKDRGGLHSFRRFFISYCANQGVPPTVLMKWVGHSDLRMIVRYYQLQDAESQQAMEALTAGSEFPGFKTNLRQTGVPEKQPRPQLPVFQVVASAS